jgi:hypothetical protein
VEDLKKMKANVSIMDMCRIPQQNDFMLQALKSIEPPMKSTNLGEVPSHTDLKNKPSVNSFSLDKIGNHFVPPFLLTFEVFNRNLHNFLVNSGASSNVMSLSICKKLNATPLKSDKNVIQIDRTQVNVIGELKDVVGPRPIFGETWSCLTVFGTLTGWSKMKCQAKRRSRDLAPFSGIFGFRVYVTGIGCRPMGLPMFRPRL